MTMEIWTAYLLAAAVLTVTPGLDTALILRTSAHEGAGSGALAALGIGLGCLCWGSAAALGLGFLFAAWPLGFTALRLLGAGYIAWLGLLMLLRPCTTLNVTSAGTAASGALAFRRGFATNILNPKVGIFYVTLLPQFLPEGVDATSASLQLALAHVVLALAWFTLVARLAGSLTHYLRKPDVAALVDRVTGAMFVGFGISLALGAGAMPS